ncbi:hypothetical protein FRB99_005641 [Tulasnella sp. 403]|nr:hypothetical protein FRB99_005641 [Tulasnella sp. 403]
MISTTSSPRSIRSDLPNTPPRSTDPDSEDAEAAEIRRGYELRTLHFDSVYDRLVTGLFRDPTFAGHTDCFKGVWAQKNRNGRIKFVKRTNVPLKVLVFGEIASHADGTRIGARGDKYPEEDYVLMQDHIRHRYVLRRPTLASPYVNAAYEDQLRNLQGLMIMAEGGPERLISSLLRRMVITPFVDCVTEHGAVEYIRAYTNVLYERQSQAEDDMTTEQFPGVTEDVVGPKQARSWVKWKLDHRYHIRVQRIKMLDPSPEPMDQLYDGDFMSSPPYKDGLDIASTRSSSASSYY